METGLRSQTGFLRAATVTDLRWIYDCGTLLASASLPLTVALFLAALSGSLTHCAVMCSTFVLAQTQNQTNGLPGRGAQLLLPYHAGRLVTYTTLGAVVGLGFHFISATPVFAVVRHLLLTLVAVLFLATFAERALSRFGVRLPAVRGLAPGCAISAMRRVGATHGALARFSLGMALGFLPCPMVFAALMAVAATADPLKGAMGMAAFALGTMPVLMGIGVAGSGFLNSSPCARQALSLAAFGVNGVVLLALALS